MSDPTRVTVIDFETTSKEPEEAHIVEYARCSVNVDRMDADAEVYTTLVDPGAPIPAEASAVHLIRDEHVQSDGVDTHRFGAIVSSEVGQQPTHWCAHNAAYDRGVFASNIDHKEPPVFLCTYRLARHLYRDAPTHSLMGLWHWLELWKHEPELNAMLEGDDMQPHRALFDAICCAMLLRFMLRDKESRLPKMAWSEARLADIQRRGEKPFIIDTMPFGKHKGTPFDEIPVDYLRWMRKNIDDEDIQFNIRRQLKGE